MEDIEVNFEAALYVQTMVTCCILIFNWKKKKRTPLFFVFSPRLGAFQMIQSVPLNCISIKGLKMEKGCF